MTKDLSVRASEIQFFKILNSYVFYNYDFLMIISDY